MAYIFTLCTVSMKVCSTRESHPENGKRTLCRRRRDSVSIA